MGLCYSKDDSNKEVERSVQIDKQIEKEKVKQEYKILLLGLSLSFRIHIVYSFDF